MSTTLAINSPTEQSVTEQILTVSIFEEQVARFNEVYALEQYHLATRKDMAKRLGVFKKMLAEELDEIDEIIEKLVPPIDNILLDVPVLAYQNPLQALTDIADLLGDLQVYCASEMIRFNIPVLPTQTIIMDSNMSKLGDDGKPIKRADGKVMKGPNYWKPEPAIAEMLKKHYAQDPECAWLSRLEYAPRTLMEVLAGTEPAAPAAPTPTVQAGEKE